MKLSIVIPVYCVEATLERCLQSVCGQTFTDFEVILVDDGSPDRCPQLCDEWAEKDSRIRVIHKENGGLSDARNAGIDAARGEYITFVDSDDFLSTDTYEHVMPATAQADIVEFPVYWHYGAKEQKILDFGDQSYDREYMYWLRGRAYEHAYAWNKVYQRELFDGVRFPVGRVFEDVATLPRLLAKEPTVKTIRKGMYYYCANPEGITATATGKELTMLLDAHLQLLKKYVDGHYYLHVLNIQMDVYRLTGQQPRLYHSKVYPWATGFTLADRCKAIGLHIFNIKTLCVLNKIIYWFKRDSQS